MKTFGIATKAVIFDQSGRVLLIGKSDIEDINPNTIDIPGGRLEFNETPEEGIKRECLEEVNLDVEVVAPTRTWTLVKSEKDFQLVGITFLCTTNDANITLSEEHTQADWLNPDEVLDADYPGWIKDEIRAALRLKRLLEM